MAWLGGVVTHPSRKNKYAARVGHPTIFHLGGLAGAAHLFKLNVAHDGADAA
jgi:hypothetical protein